MDQNPVILEADVSEVEAARLQEIPSAKDEDGGRKVKDDNPERRFVLIPKSDTYDPNEESEVELGKAKKEHKLSNGGSGLGKESRASGSSNDEGEARKKERGHKLSNSESGARREEREYRSSNDEREAKRGEKGYKLPNGQNEVRREDQGYRIPNGEGEAKRGDNRSSRERDYMASNNERETEMRRTERNNRPPNSEPRRDDRKEPPRLDRPIKDERRTSYRGEVSRPEERRPSERPDVERRRSRQDLPVIETKIPREIPPQFRRSVSNMSSGTGTPKVAFGTPGTPAEIFLSPEVLRPAKDFHQPQQPVPRANVHEALWGKNSTPVDTQRSADSLGSHPRTPVAEKKSSGNLENGGRPPAEKLTRPQQLAGEIGGRRHERLPSPAKSTRSSNHSAYDYSGSEEDSLESDSDHHRRHSRRHREDRRRRSPSRSNRSSLDVKSASRFSTPLPSPKISPSQLQIGGMYEKAETFPSGKKEKPPISRPVSPFSAEKMDRLTPTDNPKSRQASSVLTPIPARPLVPLNIVPMPIPMPSTSREPGRSPAVPQYEENKPLGPRPLPQAQAQAQAQPKPYWQPPSFQPPPQNFEKPVGSFRRFSEDVERGQIAPLPTCPRTKGIRGWYDWRTLPQIAEFDICPQCFSSTIVPTEYGDLFVPSPRRSPNTEIKCDFGSSPWYRIAWLLTLKERRHDLSLFYGLADIADTVEPCNGKHDAIRTWYSVKDPRTGGTVKDFDVCFSCVRNVEVLLPAVRGVFVRSDTQFSKTPRICDMRFESKRFVKYFDALEIAAAKPSKYGPPDTRDLVRLASIPECQHDQDIINGHWHTITQLPEFTVCEECFDEVVGPDIDDGKAIAKMFSKGTRPLPRASCQLYGEKMRGIFRVAVDGEDYRYLASKARERRKAEEEFKRAVAELRRQPSRNPGIEREIKRREEEWSVWE